MSDRPLWELDTADFDLLHELPVCGCGHPDNVYDVYRRVLANAVQASDSWRNDIDWPSWDDRVAAAEGNETLFYMAAYLLDHIEATEHGGSVEGAWATDKGRRLLDLLNEFKTYDYDAYPTRSRATQ